MKIFAGVVALVLGSLHMVQCQDTGLGACFFESDGCESVVEPEQDTTFMDCVCMGGMSFGFVEAGVRGCAGITPDGATTTRRRDLGVLDRRQEEGLQPSRLLRTSWFGRVWRGIKKVGRKIIEFCSELEIKIEDGFIKICFRFRRRLGDAHTKLLPSQDSRLLQEQCYQLEGCDGDIAGEPHIKQLGSGGWFDYHGECDLVFSSAPGYHDGLGLAIHARTMIRYSYSFIVTAAIQLGSDVLEVSGYGQYFLNGVEGADLTGEDSTLSGHSITYSAINKKRHSFEIDIGAGNSIYIHTMKDIVSVKLQSDSGWFGPEMRSWFGNSTGLMGSFKSNKKLARDGVTILEDPNTFGQEWQVRDDDPKLFQNPDRPPQYPAKCILPSDIASEESRRLIGSVSYEEADKACENWSASEKDHCIYDVMATGDLELALAGAY